MRSSVTIDLDDIDFNDLCDEVHSRLEYKYLTSSNKSRKQLCIDRAKYVVEKFGGGVVLNETKIDIQSVDDELKMTHIAKVFKKYSSQQLEQLIP